LNHDQMESRYLLQFDEISNKTIDELVQVLTQAQGLKVKDCKIDDLIFYQGEPIYSGNGVYIFKSVKRFYYVGSCVARNFVERIPAHFDLRESGWFNSLLDNIRKQNGEPRTNLLLTQAAKHAMENCSLVLINFSFGDHVRNISNIKSLEALLRRVLHPYNYLKQRPINRLLKLGDYLNSTVSLSPVKSETL
jgi:hypothetical protein